MGRTLLNSPSCLALAAQVEYGTRRQRRHSGVGDADEADKLLNTTATTTSATPSTGAHSPPILVRAAKYFSTGYQKEVVSQSMKWGPLNGQSQSNTLFSLGDV